MPGCSLRILLLSFLALTASNVTGRAMADCPETGRTLDSETLRVVSLNVAHGRKDARNQLLLSAETIRKNLLGLGVLLDRARADMIGLQEADAASRWSGGFDHVAFLAENTAYPCAAHGIHASSFLYRFGTALLSPHPLQGSFVHSFAPSPPTTTKGFTLAALNWNPGNRLADPLRVKFASVHLDFSRRSVRRAQTQAMIRLLSGIEGPMILMGDFNTDWRTEDSSLRLLAEGLDLGAYEPHAGDLSTYGDEGARLDWILVSSQLEFRRYAVYPDVVSDHHAVAADIALVESQ
jgi:endonuclease/exonuclease/phosphatase family metal-dependent hydrolase